MPHRAGRTQGRYRRWRGSWHLSLPCGYQESCYVSSKSASKAHKHWSPSGPWLHAGSLPSPARDGFLVDSCKLGAETAPKLNVSRHSSGKLDRTSVSHRKKPYSVPSHVVQWLRRHSLSVGGPGLIPDQSTRLHIQQIRVSMLHLRFTCHNLEFMCCS